MCKKDKYHNLLVNILFEARERQRKGGCMMLIRFHKATPGSEDRKLAATL